MHFFWRSWKPKHTRISVSGDCSPIQRSNDLVQIVGGTSLWPKTLSYSESAEKSIQLILCCCPLDDAFAILWKKLNSLPPSKNRQRLLKEIVSRLEFMDSGRAWDILTLNRLTFSLSGGEFFNDQNSHFLGFCVGGSMLFGTEPSIDCIQEITDRLVGLLKVLPRLWGKYRDCSSSMRKKSWGCPISRLWHRTRRLDLEVNGGELLFQGTIEELNDIRSNYTGKILFAGEEQISKKTATQMETIPCRQRCAGKITLKKSWRLKISPECSHLPDRRIMFGKIHAYQKSAFTRLLGKIG